MACCSCRCATVTTRSISRSPTGPRIPPRWNGSSTGCSWIWWKPGRPRSCRMSCPNSPRRGQEAPERQPVQGADDASIPFGLDDPDGDLGFYPTGPAICGAGGPAVFPLDPDDRPSVRAAPLPPAKQIAQYFSRAARRAGTGKGERPSVREELRGDQGHAARHRGDDAQAQSAHPHPSRRPRPLSRKFSVCFHLVYSYGKGGCGNVEPEKSIPLPGASRQIGGNHASQQHPRYEDGPATTAAF